MTASRNGQDDKDLFQRTVGAVTPVKGDKIQPPVRRGSAMKQKPGAAAAAPATAAAADGEENLADFQDAAASAGGELRYRRPGVQDKAFQRLQRGQERMEAELDLHGVTIAAARGRLAAFLDRCLVRGCRCVKIVHGKGLHSAQGQATIKSLAGGWLQQRREVLAYCSAKPRDGGAGALYVLLKKRARH